MAGNTLSNMASTEMDLNVHLVLYRNLKKKKKLSGMALKLCGSRFHIKTLDDAHSSAPKRPAPFLGLLHKSGSFHTPRFVL